MNKEKIDITVVIPVHELDEISKPLFLNALNSVGKQTVDAQVLIVHPKNDVLESEIEDIMAQSNVLLDNMINVSHTEATDFCSQINYGVSQVKTTYFSILELDDEYSDIYFKNVEKYLAAYPKVSAFLPITVVVDKEDKPLIFANEGVWAHGFGEKLGFLDMNSLLVYNEFMVSGAVINKEAFEEVGGFKSDIKLYFTYEFLLRFVHNDFSTMVIPKMGYKHMFGREGSLFVQYQNPESGIKPDEAKFYLDAAKKEYLFNPNEIKREVKYSAATTE